MAEQKQKENSNPAAELQQQEVPGFELVEKLFESSSSVVFRASRTSNGELVILKIPRVSSTR